MCEKDNVHPQAIERINELVHSLRRNPSALASKTNRRPSCSVLPCCMCDKRVTSGSVVCISTAHRIHVRGSRDYAFPNVGRPDAEVPLYGAKGSSTGKTKSLHISSIKKVYEGFPSYPWHYPGVREDNIHTKRGFAFRKMNHSIVTFFSVCSPVLGKYR